MSRCVIDASSVGRALLPDEQDERSEHVLGWLTRSTPVQPAHWPIEVCGIVLRATRRNRLSAKLRDQLMDSALTLISAAEVQPPAHLSSVIAMALKFQLTIYDAAYLELASRQNLPLLTSDKALGEAARKAKVVLVSP